MKRQGSRLRRIAAAVIALSAMALVTTLAAESGALRVHNIFGSNMVIQRDKPITIWGWAEPGHKVSIRFGQAKTEATAGGEAGGWEVTFPARQANATGQKLTVTSGDEMIEMDNILVGDVWVMNGQSNMAFGLGKTYRADICCAGSASHRMSHTHSRRIYRSTGSVAGPSARRKPQAVFLRSATPLHHDCSVRCRSPSASLTTRAAARRSKAWFPVTSSTTTRWLPDIWTGSRSAVPSLTGTQP